MYGFKTCPSSTWSFSNISWHFIFRLCIQHFMDFRFSDPCGGDRQSALQDLSLSDMFAWFRTQRNLQSLFNRRPLQVWRIYVFDNARSRGSADRNQPLRDRSSLFQSQEDKLVLRGISYFWIFKCIIYV